MVVAVYFTNWSIYARSYTPDRLPFEHATHIIYAFLKPGENGVVGLSDPWADVEKPMPHGGLGCLGELQLLKTQRNPGIRILGSIGGYTYSAQLAAIACDPGLRAKLIASSCDLVAKHSLDGLDIDWEYPTTPQEVSAFVSLIHELRAALSQLETELGRPLELSVAASAGWNELPLSRIDRCISFYNLMAYDFAGPWSPAAGHHADLYPDGDGAVSRYLGHKIHPSKLVLGIPLYGRSFKGARGPGSPFHGQLPGPYEAGVHDFHSLPLPNSREYTDRDAVAAFCVSPEGMVSYDNLETVRAKADYVRARKLGGGMFWEASGDTSLVEAFSRRLNG